MPPAAPAAQPFGGFVERHLAEPRRPPPQRLSLGGAPADDLAAFQAQIENGDDLLVPLDPAEPLRAGPATELVLREADVTMTGVADGGAGPSSGSAAPAAATVAELLPGVAEIDIAGVDQQMRMSHPAALLPDPTPAARAPAPQAVPSPVSPVSPETQPVPYVPYKLRFRFAEATGHLLQLLKDAGHRGSGQGVGPAVDMLLQLPGLVLNGGGAGRGRHRGVNRKLKLFQAGNMEELNRVPL